MPKNKLNKYYLMKHSLFEAVFSITEKWRFYCWSCQF